MGTLADLYIADPADPSYATPLIDFLSFDSPADYGFNVADGSLDLGGAALEQEWVHSYGVGGILVSSFAPESELRANLMTRSDSYDNIAAAVLALARAMAAGGVIVWQPANATTAVFIDYYPSSIPALLRGQDRAMHKIIELLMDPDGFPIAIKRHPYARRPEEAAVDSVSVSNGLNAGAVKATNSGSAPSETRIEIAIPSGGADVVQARVGIRSGGNVDEFVASLANFSISTIRDPDNGWRKLWEKTISPSDETALIGNYRVYAVASFGTDDIYEVRLHWGWSNTDPLGNVGDELTFDTTSVGTSQDVEVDLGEVRFERGSGQLVLQAWGRSEFGGSINWSRGILMPTSDQLITVSVPGQRHGRFDYEVYRGDELLERDEPPPYELTDSGVLILSEQNQTGSMPLSAGIQLPAGRHVVDMRGHVRNLDRIRTKVGELQVLEEGSVIKANPIRALKGEIRRQYGRDDPLRVQFDANGSSRYSWRANYTEATDEDRSIGVAALRRYFVPTLKSGLKFVIDALEETVYVADSGGVRVWPAHASSLPKLAAGDSAVVVRLGDRTPLAYDTIDFREPLTEIVGARAANLSVVINPRELIT